MGGEEINAAFSGKLAGLNATSQSIETLSHWCVFHRKRAKTLVPTWQQELRAAPPKRKLTFLYLANDVLQNSRKKGNEWIEACWPIMAVTSARVLVGEDVDVRQAAEPCKDGSGAKAAWRAYRDDAR